MKPVVLLAMVKDLQIYIKDIKDLDSIGFYLRGELILQAQDADKDQGRDEIRPEPFHVGIITFFIRRATVGC